MTESITTPSEYLVSLAWRVTRTYLPITQPRAVLLVGSAATGESTFYSDIDMSIYYDVLPPADAITAARDSLGAQNIAVLGEQAGQSYVESFEVDGIEIQIGHVTISKLQQTFADVFSGKEVGTPLMKVLSGVSEGMPLHGDQLIHEWQAQLADVPDGLARAMVKHYLRFPPLWFMWERLQSEDATIFIHAMLVESAQNLIGVLAALNRLYYTPFHFKRMAKFLARMHIAPHDTYTRLERLFSPDPAIATQTLESLVQDTVVLVEQHMPEVETSAARKRLSKRQLPWQPPTRDRT